MKKPRKRKKPLVGTWYAVRDKTDDTFWNAMETRWGRFAGCALYPTRSLARDEENDWGWDKKTMEIVPVRCRPLTSKKRNVKRTR